MNDRLIPVFNFVDRSWFHIFPLLPSGKDWLHVSTSSDLSDGIPGSELCCLRGIFI